MSGWVSEMTNYREEIAAHYTGLDGAIHGVRNPTEIKTSGNHHVIMATHLLMLIHHGERLSLEDVEQYRHYIEACRHSKGIFHRVPGYPDRQTHDDLLAIAVSSYILGLPYAKEIAERGMEGTEFSWFTCPWYFDNEDKKEFELRKWFGRFFWFQAAIKAAAGVKLSLIDKLAYAIYLLSGCRESKIPDTSGKQLRFITMHPMMHGSSWIISWAMRYYLKRVAKQYANGFLEIYYGKDHPFAKAT
jgi:hypothetical protein